MGCINEKSSHIVIRSGRNVQNLYGQYKSVCGTKCTNVDAKPSEAAKK